jgi:hypothetical protein
MKLRRRRSSRAYGEITPNARARSLAGRPSMDTSAFGKDLDDNAIDGIGGAEGRHLDGAMQRYTIFHAKDPIRVAELAHDIPTSWRCTGDALAVMYRTDKWKPDGVDEDYKHLHDRTEGQPYPVNRGVRFYEPAAEAPKSKVDGLGGRPSLPKPSRLPVATPKAITLLGYCLGAFVRRDDTGEEYEVNPRGCYLYSSPGGDLLLLYSPEEQPDGSSGFLAAFAGGKLRVLKDGIDG